MSSQFRFGALIWGVVFTIANKVPYIYDKLHIPISPEGSIQIETSKYIFGLGATALYLISLVPILTEKLHPVQPNIVFGNKDTIGDPPAGFKGSFYSD